MTHDMSLSSSLPSSYWYFDFRSDLSSGISSFSQVKKNQVKEQRKSKFSLKSSSTQALQVLISKNNGGKLSFENLIFSNSSVGKYFSIIFHPKCISFVKYKSKSYINFLVVLACHILRLALLNFPFRIPRREVSCLRLETTSS